MRRSSPCGGRENSKDDWVPEKRRGLFGIRRRRSQIWNSSRNCVIVGIGFLCPVYGCGEHQRARHAFNGAQLIFMQIHLSVARSLWDGVCHARFPANSFLYCHNRQQRQEFFLLVHYPIIFSDFLPESQLQRDGTIVSSRDTIFFSFVCLKNSFFNSCRTEWGEAFGDRKRNDACFCFGRKYTFSIQRHEGSRVENTLEILSPTKMRVQMRFWITYLLLAPPVFLPR